MRTLCLLGMTAVLMASGCASQDGDSFVKPGFDFSSVTRVAVLPPEGMTYNAGVQNQIATYFEMELMRKGYDCVARTEINRVVKEQELQASGITSSQGMATAGQILNTPVIMVVNVPQFDDKISLTAKLIRVEDGALLWVGEGSGGTGKTMSTIVGAVGGAVVGVLLAGDDSSDRVAAGVAGGLLGGVAGNAIAPSVEKQFKKIVRDKVCKALPARHGAIASAK
jgi:hypothetical protein